MQIERWQEIKNRLIVDDDSNKAIIVKDDDTKTLTPLSVKNLIKKEGLPVEEARTKLLRDTLRSTIVLDKLTIIRKFKDKGQYENAQKTEKLVSNRPIEQYKQIKAEFKFFGQSFLEGFLDIYGLEVDRALENYENTLKVLEEEKLGQKDKDYYIGVISKGKAEKITEQMHSREFAIEELRKFNASLKKEQTISKHEELQNTLSNNKKLEKE